MYNFTSYKALESLRKIRSDNRQACKHKKVEYILQRYSIISKDWKEVWVTWNLNREAHLVATWLSENKTWKMKHTSLHIHLLHWVFSKIHVHFLGATKGEPHRIHPPTPLYAHPQIHKKNQLFLHLQVTFTFVNLMTFKIKSVKTWWEKRKKVVA